MNIAPQRFLTEPSPNRGVMLPVLPGIHRVVAPNPTVMTYHGTNTYVVDDGRGRFIVIDPGPANNTHVKDVLQCTAGQISLILLTHTHSDHLGALSALKEATGAPTAGFHINGSEEFAPDVPLHDGARIGPFEAVHTPGHAPDHLCFSGHGGVLFSGDHVMGWSSSIVDPPKGDMQAYYFSLKRLLERDDTTYLPGHGPVISDPQTHVTALLSHRKERERAILSLLEVEPRDTYTIMDILYSKQDARLREAAERNVLAHLIKLFDEGAVLRCGNRWCKNVPSGPAI